MRAMDIFNDTIRIVHQGYYIKDGKRINLKLNCSEMKTVRVFLPKEVHSLSEYKFEKHIFNIGINLSYRIDVSHLVQDSCLAILPSTPFTKAELLSPPNRFASSTASLIATPSGTSLSHFIS